VNAAISAKAAALAVDRIFGRLPDNCSKTLVYQMLR